MILVYCATARSVKNLQVTDYIKLKDVTDQGHTFMTETDYASVKKVFPDKFFKEGEEGFVAPKVDISIEQRAKLAEEEVVILKERNEELEAANGKLFSENEEIKSANATLVSDNAKVTGEKSQLASDLVASKGEVTRLTNENNRITLENTELKEKLRVAQLPKNTTSEVKEKTETPEKPASPEAPTGPDSTGGKGKDATKDEKDKAKAK